VLRGATPAEEEQRYYAGAERHDGWTT